MNNKSKINFHSPALVLFLMFNYNYIHNGLNIYIQICKHENMQVCKCVRVVQGIQALIIFLALGMKKTWSLLVLPIGKMTA